MSVLKFKGVLILWKYIDIILKMYIKRFKFKDLKGFNILFFKKGIMILVIKYVKKW